MRPRFHHTQRATIAKSERLGHVARTCVNRGQAHDQQRVVIATNRRCPNEPATDHDSTLPEEYACAATRRASSLRSSEYLEAVLRRHITTSPMIRDKRHGVHANKPWLEVEQHG
jgi:hypothetical protein